MNRKSTKRESSPLSSTRNEGSEKPQLKKLDARDLSTVVGSAPRDAGRFPPPDASAQLAP